MKTRLLLPATNFFKRSWQPLLLGAAIVFVYWQVLQKLVIVWWSDENYQHGLLIPFLIGYLLWLEKARLAKIMGRELILGGGAIIAAALILLLGGTLGAELFTQRWSFVLMLAGIAVYFFGWRILKMLSVPLALLAFAVPIPAILWNQIAFPLQLLATDLAVSWIRLAAVPAVKFGNIIEILPVGAGQTVQFEVVEACSGIRSLMTLATLALVYAFFTRRIENYEKIAVWRNSDFWRAVFLLAAALPIAVLTNAGRIVATVLIARSYGKETADGFLHGFSGWLVYLAALTLVFLSALIFDYARNTLLAAQSETVQPH